MPSLVTKYSLVCPGREVENRIFPIEKHRAYITVPCATAMAFDYNKLYFHKYVHYASFPLTPSGYEIAAERMF